MAKRLTPIRLGDEQYAALRQRAAAKGITVSDLIRFLLDRGVQAGEEVDPGIVRIEAKSQEEHSHG